MANAFRTVKLKISNIKVRIKLTNITNNCICSPIRFNHPKNYCIIKNKFVYIIFKYNTVNTINITKIKCKQQIFQAINHILNLLNLSKKNLKYYKNKYKKKLYKIDNISLYSNLPYKRIPIPIFDIHTYIKSKQIYTNLISSYKYSNIFKSLSLWTKYKKGKILLFQSGKFNILGVKSFKQILSLKNSLITLFFNLLNNNYL